MNVLDPATLRTVAADLDNERETETRHIQHCRCGVPTIHAARVGLLDDLAARLRTAAIRAELKAKEATA